MSYSKLGWNFIEAHDFLRQVERIANECGLHVGMCGSVLHRGASTDDLDLVVFPLKTKKGYDFAKFQYDLQQFGCFDWKNISPYHGEDTKLVFSCFKYFKQRIDWFIFDIPVEKVEET